ncbi:MAG: hypothetical protein HY525_19765 [Betaproteobacteria bacterium]|nr:hypothetical protein [Betaproteobacteria bacterium]
MMKHEGTLEAVVADHKSTRETLASMLTQLEAIVTSAKKEAVLTADVRSRIEGATAHLANRHEIDIVCRHNISPAHKSSA